MGNVPPSALRQPPPPGRRVQLIDSNAKPAPTPPRVRNRPFYFRKSKKGNTSNSMFHSNSMIESLPVPDELLIEILLRLSADDIFDNARLVCRRWRHLIHSIAFAYEQFHRDSSGLLLVPISDSLCPKMSPIFVTATMQGRVQISELSCRINFPIMCSCNGLALCWREREDSGSRERIPFIFNPATKYAFSLPRLPVLVRGKLLHRLDLAYAAASMAYKVVGTYHIDKSRITHSGCIILTVGVDKTWRHVSVEGLSAEAINTMMQITRLMTQGGFLHWVSRTHVVSLNVETEIFTVTPTPALMIIPNYKEGMYEYYPLSTGECLSLLVSCGDWSWQVWEMKPETWEWRKVLPNIDLEAHKCKIQQLASKKDDIRVKPIGWVRYPEVLAFFISNLSCIVYNLDTEELESIELSIRAGYHCVVVHRNSLVWSERS